jgi:hypothetical protein
MQPPIWKRNVNVSGFAERNKEAIRSEEKIIADEMATPTAKAGFGTVKFSLGGGLWEDRDAEGLEDDPVYGGIATEALFKRDAKSLRDKMDQLEIDLSDPEKKGQRLTAKEREEILTTGSGLQEIDPVHAELKAKLIKDDELAAKEKEQWESKKRLQELGSMGVNGYREERARARLNSVATVDEKLKERETAIAEREASGIVGKDLAAHAAEKAQVAEERKLVEQRRSSVTAGVLNPTEGYGTTTNGVFQEANPNKPKTLDDYDNDLNAADQRVLEAEKIGNADPQKIAAAKAEISAQRKNIATFRKDNEEAKKRQSAIKILGVSSQSKAIAGKEEGIYQKGKDFFNEIFGNSKDSASIGALLRNKTLKEAISSAESDMTADAVYSGGLGADMGGGEQAALERKEMAQKNLPKLKQLQESLGDDADRIISDASKEYAWTADTTDSVRELSTGSMAFNPALIFGDNEALKKKIQTTGNNAEKQGEALERLDAMRKGMAKELKGKLYSADYDFKAFADERKGTDDVALLDEWRKSMTDRNPIVKFADVVLNEIANGAYGIIGTGKNVAAGFASLVGADEIAGSVGQSANELSKYVEGRQMTQVNRGLTGAYGVFGDVANTATQMVPMLAGGAVARGLKPLAAAITRVAAVEGTSFLQGAGSKYQDAVNLEEEKFGRGLTNDEIAEVLGRKETRIAAFSNGAQTALLNRMLPSGPERIVTGGAARTMTVLDFLSKGGRKAIKDAGLKAELKQIGKTMFADATDEALEEGINQMLDGIISTAALGKDMKLGDLLEESFKAAMLGGLVGGVLPQVRFSVRDQASAKLVENGGKPLTAEEERKAAEMGADLEDPDKLAQNAAVLREIESVRAAAPEVADRVSGAVKLAQGKSLDELTAVEIAALGINRDGTPLEGSPNPPMVEMVNGKPVLLDAALVEMEDVAPSAKGIATMTEGEARAKFSKQKFTVTSESGASVEVEAKDEADAQVIAAKQFAMGDKVASVTPLVSTGAGANSQGGTANPPNAGNPAGDANSATPVDNQQAQVGLNSEANKLLDSIDDNGALTGTVDDLKRVAAENGVTVTDDMTPADIVEAIRANLSPANKAVRKIRKKRKGLASVLTISNDPNDRAYEDEGLITINPDRLMEDALKSGMTEAQALKWIEKVIDEELRHVAQYRAAQEIYKKSGDTRPFKEWRESYYKEVWKKEFVDTGNDSVVSNLYGKGFDSLEDWQKAVEGIRMMWQQNADASPTEIAKLWTKAKEEVIKNLRAMLKVLKSMASDNALSDEMKNEITLLQKALKDLEAMDPNAQQSTPNNFQIGQVVTGKVVSRVGSGEEVTGEIIRIGDVNMLIKVGNKTTSIAIAGAVAQSSPNAAASLDASSERVNISDLKNSRGQIGNQGFTAESAVAIINYATGENYSDTNLKAVLESVKGNPAQVEALKSFLETTPIVTSSLPDGTISLDDGHHRAFLADQLGMTSLPTISPEQAKARGSYKNNAAGLDADTKPSKKTSFNFTVATEAIPSIKQKMLDGKFNEVAELTKIAVTHALSDLKGVSARFKDSTGWFANSPSEAAYSEPSSQISIAYKNDSDLPMIRARMADLAELFEQYEMHEISDDSNISDDQLGEVNDDGTQNQLVSVIRAPKVSIDEIEKARKSAGIQGLTVNADGSIELYTLKHHGTDPEKFTRQVKSFYDQINVGAGGAANLSTRRRKIRVWSKANTDGANGITNYQDNKVRDGAAHLISRLTKRLPEMVGKMFKAPAAKRSYVTSKDYTPTFQLYKMKIADAYESAKTDDLANPNVRKAYEELQKEIYNQYVAMTKGEDGIRYQYENYVRKNPQTGEEIMGDLYGSSREAVADIRGNRLRVLKTDPSAFGPEGSDFSSHPLLQDTGLTYVDADGKTQPILYNDMFRAVHDTLAHGLFSDQFGAIGEEAAWAIHSRTIDNPWARWALTTETRGQNSWVNEGPQMRNADGSLKVAGDEGYLSPKKRDFAVQKATLLPIEFAMTGDPDVDAPMIALQAELEGAKNNAASLDSESDEEAETNGEDLKAGVQKDIPMSVDEASSIQSNIALAGSKAWARGRDMKISMQKAVLDAAKAAGVNLSLVSPQLTEYLSRVGLNDALFAIKQNPNAVGWYDEKTKQAIGVMGLLHPELNTDEDSKFAFIWALACTSNGQKVNKNFELAEKVYSEYKSTGLMPSNLLAGNSQDSINKSLELFNSLKKEWGISNLRAFMQTKFSVGEIGGIQKSLTPTGEHSATIVRGSAIIGPKVGNGFFSNLYGYFDALTMDRWLVRTWGRWTGTLIDDVPDKVEDSRQNLLKALDAIGEDGLNALAADTESTLSNLSLEDLSAKLTKLSTKKEKRKMMMSSPVRNKLRKTANNYTKYLDGQKEAPSGPNERNYIREIFGNILTEMRKIEGFENLEMADLQAVLWYAEKRLYENAKDKNLEVKEAGGYDDTEAPDYANAAVKLVLEKGVTQRKINYTLKKYGRSTAAQQSDGEVGTELQGEQRKTGELTSIEKRRFIQSLAVRRARSDISRDGGKSPAYSGISGADGKRVRVLKNLGVSYETEWKPSAKFSHVYRTSGMTPAQFVELQAGDSTNATKFKDLITIAKKESKYGAAVHAYSAEEYAGMRLFLSKDGSAGMAIKNDGDIVSLFSRKGSTSGSAALALAITAGGRKLDAFDTILPQFNANHGFVVASRIPFSEEFKPEDWDYEVFKDYNNGRPDVVFMVYDPNYNGWYSRKDGKKAKDAENAGNIQRLAASKVSKTNKNSAASLYSEYDEVMAKYEGNPKFPSTTVTPKKRVYSPIVRDLLQRREDGENISKEVIARAIDKHFPSYKVPVPKSMKDLPSQNKVLAAVTKDKRKAHEATVDLGMPTAGEIVTVRQDVPAMTENGVGVVTTTSKNGNLYLPAVRILNPDFQVREKPTLKIALGGEKGPHIVIKGAWMADQSMPADLKNWTQVGFNPDRHSYYYERGTNKPVIKGEEAFQIGNTVFVRVPEYGKARNFNFAASLDTDYLAAVAGGDMETAQRMVDEAAREAGYDVERYHITPYTFTQFRTPSEFTDEAGMQRLKDTYPKENSMRVFIRAERVGEISGNLADDKVAVLQFAQDNNLDAVTVGSNWGDLDDIIVINPNQIKSADPVTYDDNGNVIPLSQRFNPKTDNINNAASLDTEVAPFYSQLSQVIDQKMPSMSNIGQVMQIAMQNAKAEEVKWSGLQQALTTMQDDKGKVTKEAVLRYLNNEGVVRFEESNRGYDQAEEKRKEDTRSARVEIADLRTDLWSRSLGQRQLDVLSAEAQEGEGVVDDYLNLLSKKYPEEAEKLKRFTELARLIGRSDKLDPPSPRYSQYVLEGGKNYREVVLAMPIGKPWEVFNPVDGVAVASFDTEAEAKAEASRLDSGYDYGKTTDKGGSTYRSSHFPDIPDYVAHMRLNERDNGLFIEEIQSDRHQEGRKKGYRGELLMFGGKVEAYTPDGYSWAKTIKPKSSSVTHQLVRDSDGVVVAEGAIKIEVLRKSGLTASVADAPFRSTWHLALFKRALRDAVASGKTWIGWTTGETQNDRFDLSKSISEIAYWKEDDGWGIGALDLNGDAVMDQEYAKDANALESMVGKELAQKIVNDEGGDGQDYQSRYLNRRTGKLEEGVKVFTGDDLRVGGSGMKGFYDNMLVKDIGKYVKQWGGKVEKASLRNPDKRATVQYKQVAQEMFGRPASELNDSELRQVLTETSKRESDANSTPIWRVDITPEMRATVKGKGQALFAANLMDEDRAKDLLDQQAEFGNAVKPPNRASMGNENTRRVVDAFDIEYEERRETETREQWVKRGKKLANSDRKGLIENAIANATGAVGAVPLRPEDIVGTQIVIEQMVQEAGNDYDKLLEAGVVIQSYRKMRSDVARVLASGWDRLMKPDERNRRFLSNAILTLPAKVAASIDRKYLSPAQAKAEIRKKLQDRLTEIEKALKEYGVTINEVLGKQVYMSLDKSGIVRDIMKDSSKNEALAMRMHAQHSSAEQIAKATRMTVSEVEKLIQKVYNEALERMKEKVRGGATLENSGLGAASVMSEAEIEAEARRMVEVGLGISPRAHSPSTKALARKVKPAPTAPQKVNWARPEFTSGLLNYTFDSKDLVDIKQNVQALVDATAAKAKVESIEDPVKRANAEKMLASIEAILKKYGTDISTVVASGKPLESYRFDITDRMHVHLISNAIRSVDADWIDKATEYGYFSLLSGLQTMMVNASSVVHGAFDATIGRGFEIMLNAFINNPMNATLGETKYMLKAMGPMLSRAKSNFIASYGAEAAFFEQDILGVPPDLESILEGHGMYHRTAISGKKGRFLRIPTRLLLATDEYVKVINAMTEVGAMAYRICRAGGLKPDSKAFDDKMKELVNVTGSLAWQLAAQKAYTRTFTGAMPSQKDQATGEVRPVRTSGEAIGSVVAKVQSAIAPSNNENMLVKLNKTLFRMMFFPFVKIPYNITALALTYTPLSLIDVATLYVQSMGIKTPEKKMQAKAEVIERMSRVMIGGVITSLLLGIGEGDDDDLDKPILVTGSRSYANTKKGVREAAQRLGLDAYSISWKLPNGKRGVFHYGRYEPVATIISSTVDTLKQFKQAGKGRQTYGDAVSASTRAFADQLSDKTFLSGLGNFYKTIMGEQSMSKFVADKIAMLVPNLIKQPLRELDPYYRAKADTIDEEILAAVFPYGIRQAKVDIYGEKSEKLGTPITRLFDFTDSGSVEVNKVDEMLWRYQQKNPDGETLPSEAGGSYTPVKGKGQVAMTDTQARIYRERAGTNFTNIVRGRSFNYADPTDEDIKNLQKIIEVSRASALTSLKRDPNWK